MEAGKIVSLHGIKGEMRLKPWSDDAAFLKQFRFVYMSAQGGEKTRLLSARAHGNVTLIKLEGVDTPEQAEKMRGQVLYIKKSDVHLPAGSFFISDVIGLRVLDEATGEQLGVVSDVESYPANDVWHVKTPTGAVLIPHVPAIVKKVDIDEGFVSIFKMKGLFEDAD